MRVIKRIIDILLCFENDSKQKSFFFLNTTLKHARE